MMRHRLTGNTPEQAAENSCLLSGHDFKSPGNGLKNDGLLAPATVKVADEIDGELQSDEWILSEGHVYTFIVIKPQDLDRTPKSTFLQIPRSQWRTIFEINPNRRTQTHGDPSCFTGSFIQLYSPFRDDCSEWKPVLHHFPLLLTKPNDRVRFAEVIFICSPRCSSVSCQQYSEL
jgi:hypothetical protein